MAYYWMLLLMGLLHELLTVHCELWGLQSWRGYLNSFCSIVSKRLISAVLYTVLRHTKESCIASYYRQFSTNIKIIRMKWNTSLNFYRKVFLWEKNTQKRIKIYPKIILACYMFYWKILIYCLTIYVHLSKIYNKEQSYYRILPSKSLNPALFTVTKQL